MPLYFSLYTTVNLMAGAQNKKVGSALAHVVAASVVFGCGVWSLHFVAMLAFVSGVPISYGISLTFLSSSPYSGARRVIGIGSLAILSVKASSHRCWRPSARFFCQRHAFL